MSQKPGMRLDKFLQTTRIVKRRSVAKEVCDQRIVRVNGHPARAGRTVQCGDRIEIDFYNRELAVEILEIPGRAMRKADASRCYRVVKDRRKEEEW